MTLSVDVNFRIDREFEDLTLMVFSSIETEPKNPSYQIVFTSLVDMGQAELEGPLSRARS